MFKFKNHEKNVAYCTRCGSDGHTHLECRRDIKCHRCHQIGHFAKDCLLFPTQINHSASEARRHDRYYAKGTAALHRGLETTERIHVEEQQDANSGSTTNSQSNDNSLS